MPPAWRAVWICPRPNGHLQAVGFDQAGRRQYLYHPKWRKQRDEEKFDRLLRLAERLPAARAEISERLEQPGLDSQRVLAAAVRMIDEGVLRSGGEQYAAANETFGAATMRRRHVSVRGDRVRFGFPAKWGTRQLLRLRDGQLARVVKSLLRRADDQSRLLAYRTGDRWQGIHAEDINSYLKDLLGDEFTAKDLRTWNATVHAAVELAEMPAPRSKAAERRCVRAVMRTVAGELGNSPSMARRSYVDPRVITLFGRGVTIRTALRRIASVGKEGDDLRNAVDRAVLRMLRRHG